MTVKWRFFRPRVLPFGDHGQRLTVPVAVRYFLLQTPGWGLAVLLAWLLPGVVSIDRWLAWTMVGAWVVKDFLLLPLLWPFYVSDPPSSAHSPVGARGVAVERLAPVGYIRVGSELWRAELESGHEPVERGAAVRIVAMHELTLRVRAAGD